MLGQQEEEMRPPVQLRAEGLIPGPLETPSFFAARVDAATVRSDSWGRRVPLYQVNAVWVPINEQSMKLRFYEGGATLIEESKQQPIKCEILLNGGSLFLSEQAILEHELVHAVRCGFKDSLWEEVLSWATCPSRIVRFFGWAVLDRLQLCLWGAGFVWIMFGISLELLWMALLGAVLLGVGWWRSYGKHSILKRAIRTLEGLNLPAWAILLHLTEEEAQQIASMGFAGLQELLSRLDMRMIFLKEAFPELQQLV